MNRLGNLEQQFHVEWTHSLHTFQHETVCLIYLHIKEKNLDIPRFFRNGVPERTRTSDTQFRKLLLYPAELRGRNAPTLII
jgi:hypothetical protein